METNEWKGVYRELFRLHVSHPDTNRVLNKKVEDFISQNFIPISELKRWVEENKKEDFYDCGVSNERGHNSALKALKDRFIKE